MTGTHLTKKAHSNLLRGVAELTGPSYFWDSNREVTLHPFHKHANDFTFIKEKLCFPGSLGAVDKQVRFQIDPFYFVEELNPFTGEISAQPSKKPKPGLSENYTSLAEVCL